MRETRLAPKVESLFEAMSGHNVSWMNGLAYAKHRWLSAHRHK